jgi:penicillin-binding protein-related factor A (putative recombinase)
MATNYGKKWEQKIKEDFQRIPDVSIDRIYDSMSGYKTISNNSDFIAYMYPNMFYLEAKSTHGNTFSISKLTQYDKLITKVGIKGVRVGVVLWFIDHHKCLYVPLSTFKQLKDDGHKSVNIKMLTDKTYNIHEIPSIQKRIFLDCDYTYLKQLQEGE